MTVDYTSEYKFPISREGWFLAHVTIRRSCLLFHTTLKSLDQWLHHPIKPEPIPAWAKTNLIDYLNWVTDFIHHHHDSEEKIAFPYIAEEFKKHGEVVPEKFSSDHPTLLKAHEEIVADTKALGKSSTLESDIEIRDRLIAKFVPYMKDMFAHLDEEDTLVPLVRKLVPRKGNKKMEDKIVRSLDPLSAGGFFMLSMDKATRKAFYKDQGIPGIGVMLGIKPAMRKFENQVLRKVMEINSNAKGFFQPDSVN